jgi:hypothetical protein
MDVLAQVVGAVLDVRSSNATMAAIKAGLVFGAVGAAVGAISYSMRTPNVRATDGLLSRRREPNAFDERQFRSATVVYDKMRLPASIAENAEITIGIRCLFDNRRIDFASISSLVFQCEKVVSLSNALKSDGLPAGLVSTRSDRSVFKHGLRAMSKGVDDALAKCLSQSGWTVDPASGLPYNTSISERLNIMLETIDSMVREIVQVVDGMDSDGARSRPSASAAAADADADADADVDVDVDVAAPPDVGAGTLLETNRK